MSCLLALAFLLNHPYSQLATFYFGCLLLLGFTIIRCLAWWLVISRSNARAKRRVVILGSGRIVDELALKILRHPEMLMEIAGVLSPSDTEASRQTSNFPQGTASVRTLNVLSMMQTEKIQELTVVDALTPVPDAM